jgi:hypothetical protein
MKRKLILVVAVALVAALVGTGSAVAMTLYAGDTEKYSVAFKAEGTKRYAMQFAGRTHCYYTEPPSDIGGGGFSAFPAPKLMRDGRRGFVAHEFVGDGYSLEESTIQADFSSEGVTGRFSYYYSEGTFHCDTGSYEKPFEARRYQPMGSADAAAPTRGEKRVYYGKKGNDEIFLRMSGAEIGGIRGTFVPRCPLGKGREIPDQHALFPRPASAKVDNGSFRRRVVRGGRTRSGTGYKETIALTGRVQRDAVTGTYIRVRTTKPGEERCVTGPVPFRAVRYLPARS